MSTLFLDIDGVLNHPGTYCDETAPWRRAKNSRAVFRVPVEPACIAALNTIVAQTGAEIVVSSSWRLFAHYSELEAALAQDGLQARFVGETPDFSRCLEQAAEVRSRHGLAAPDGAYVRVTRGLEILAYLDAHPDIEHFAILDDQDDFEILMPWHIQTDPITGLTATDAARVHRALTQPYPARSLQGLHDHSQASKRV